jgi:hypothetical protein
MQAESRGDQRIDKRKHDPSSGIGGSCPGVNETLSRVCDTGNDSSANQSRPPRGFLAAERLDQRSLKTRQGRRERDF